MTLVMKTETDPTPWEYINLVRRHLKLTNFVLDMENNHFV